MQGARQNSNWEYKVKAHFSPRTRVRSWSGLQVDQPPAYDGSRVTLVSFMVDIEVMSWVRVFLGCEMESWLLGRFLTSGAFYLSQTRTVQLARGSLTKPCALVSLSLMSQPRVYSIPFGMLHQQVCEELWDRSIVTVSRGLASGNSAQKWTVGAVENWGGEPRVEMKSKANLSEESVRSQHAIVPSHSYRHQPSYSMRSSWLEASWWPEGSS